MWTTITTTVRDWWEWVREDAVVWCAGKSWLPRLPMFVYIFLIAVTPLVHTMPGDMLCAPISGLTLAVHELGHVIFRPFGEMIYVAGGSINQTIVPIILALSFLKQRDYFAISFAGVWLSFSLFDLADYIGDSRALKLQLVSLGGGDTIHDWNYLLDKWGLLSSDLDIAFGVRIVAAVVATVAVGFGAWTLYRMMTTRTLEERADLMA